MTLKFAEIQFASRTMKISSLGPQTVLEEQFEYFSLRLETKKGKKTLGQLFKVANLSALGLLV
jgi:hypothetical protein